MNQSETKPKGKVSAVLGAQWGDEGKGKLIDLIAPSYSAVGRCAGGNNAGHTIVVPDFKDPTKTVKCDFHLLPSGLAHKNIQNIIGNGTVVHIPSLLKEIDRCSEEWSIDDVAARLKISDRAQIVFDFHQQIDKIQEERKGRDMLGTTQKGIGPCYATKADRSGIRFCDLITENFADFEVKYRKIIKRISESWPELNQGETPLLSEKAILKELARYQNFSAKLKPMIIDTVNFVDETIYKDSKSLLIEGANATMLDIDYGTYPNVTSSNCSIGSACTGLSVPPQAVEEVFGVTKAYCTRVGTGPFPTEQGPNNGKGAAIAKPDLDISNPQTEEQFGEYLQRNGNEYGTTTKRPRRCGWVDCVALNYANKINRFKAFAVTKLDVLDKLPKVAICQAYTVLPASSEETTATRRGHTSGGDDSAVGSLENSYKCKTIDYFPADAKILNRCQPNYIWMDGWCQDTTQIREFEKLPENAKNFILKLEQLLNVPIRWIGVGPDRDAMIIREM